MIERIKRDKALVIFLFIYTVFFLYFVSVVYNREKSVTCISLNKNFEIPTYGDVVSWGDDSEDFAHSLGGNNNGRENSENLPLSLRQNMEYEKNSKLLEVVDKNSYPINKVETSEKVISFSFDDGYNYDNIVKILNTLKKYNLKTTFFFCGHAIDSDMKYAEQENRLSSVSLIFNEGHEVANHSNSHPNFTKLSKEKIKSEIEDCNNKIEKITGVRPVLFRYPYGSCTSSSLKIVKELDMIPIQWNIDTRDWSAKSSCSSICSSICKNYEHDNVSCPPPGSIILMHTNAKYTPEALEVVIPILINNGYKIVPISNLILHNF